MANIQRGKKNGNHENIVISSTVESMSDAQLLNELKLRGESIGPILDSTRNIYRKRLISILQKNENDQISSAVSTEPFANKSINLKTVKSTNHKSKNEKEQKCYPEISSPFESPLAISPNSSFTKKKIDPDILKDVLNMNNEEIRTALAQNGIKIGPIVPTTRELYQKKLIKLKSQNLRKERGDYGESDDSLDEDMDWSEIN